MASLLSHAVAALGIGACFYKAGIPKRVWVLGAACSVVPDFDVIGFRFGIRYGDFWGHRGFTHSIIFAALVAAIAVGITFRRALPSVSRFSLWMYFFLATASHGLLDPVPNGLFEAQSPRRPIPLSTLQAAPRGVSCKTQGQDGFAAPFL